MAKEPASIRYKNPGAMWGSALAIKWGAKKKAVTLKDGKGQGNNIAVFPTYVQGICAQLDLWRTSKKYKNKRFADAIEVWSGGNYVESYIAFVLTRVPDMARNTIMNDAFWRSPSGIAFLKTQAWHEAGKPYPAPDADWIEAQRRVFGIAPSPVVIAPGAAAASPVTATAIDTEDVTGVQTLLKQIGYHEVGEIDGIFGSRTTAAIAGFKKDWNQPGVPVIDAQLKAVLAKAVAEHWKRPIDPERKAATSAELAPKLPEVGAALTAERAGWWAAITTGASALVTGVAKTMGDAVEMLNPLKTFVADLPWGVWVGGALVVSIGLYLISRKSGDAANAATQAYQEGARV